MKEYKFWIPIIGAILLFTKDGHHFADVIYRGSWYWVSYVVWHWITSGAVIFWVML